MTSSLWATIIAAGVPSAVALVGLFRIRQVHVLVNSQRTDMLKEIASLRNELASAHIDPTTPRSERG